MIRIHDKEFELFIPEEEIKDEVHRIAKEISRDLRDKNPLFCATLNGGFMFMADLAKELDFDADICFVKYRSYSGMSTTGTVHADLPFPEKCRRRNLVIVEDIVDSGITMQSILENIKGLQPESVRIATFLFKPDCFKKDFKIDYIGRSIPNDFVVGYGMDYDDLGRFYKDIYKVI